MWSQDWLCKTTFHMIRRFCRLYGSQLFRNANECMRENRNMRIKISTNYLDSIQLREKFRGFNDGSIFVARCVSETSTKNHFNVSIRLELKGNEYFCIVKRQLPFIIFYRVNFYTKFILSYNSIKSMLFFQHTTAYFESPASNVH